MMFNLVRKRRFTLLILFILCTVSYLLFFCKLKIISVANVGHIKRSLPNQSCPQERMIVTAKGERSYADIDVNVFRPFGYRIDINCVPLPILKRIVPLQCSSVFADWLHVANTYVFSKEPPRTVAPDLLIRFLLNNYSSIGYGYENNKEAEGKYGDLWSKNTLDNYLANTTNINSIIGLALGYPDASSVYHATKKYSVKNKLGMVIGSQRPWVELLCLRNGAKRVITAEYRKINIDHDRFGYVHPIDYGNFDFIASFSSIEHSGLGRYGDPIDPIGDLREMQKIYCQLKKGGLLFIGFPIGQDSILFNLHRYYGTMRLAMMFTDFTLIDAFDGTNPNGIILTPNKLQGQNGQYLFVLEKL